MVFRPMPVIVISSLAHASCAAGVEALRAGAVEVMAKPGGPYSVGELRTALADKIRVGGSFTYRAAANREAAARGCIGFGRSLSRRGRGIEPVALIAIGASTGGTEAIEEVLTGLPADTPGVVIAQHIPAGFSRAFAERLNKTCPMDVAEAVDGDMVRPGLALSLRGNFHMIVRRAGGDYRVTVKEGPMVCYQRPSVDVLFSSVAEAAGPQRRRCDPHRHGLGRRAGIEKNALRGRGHNRAG